MEKNSSPVFRGIAEAELEEMQRLGCMRKVEFPKNAVIFHAGSVVSEIGIVVRGCVHIELNDLWGNCNILSDISAGQVFAESYALCQEPMMVDAVAAENCEILFVNLNLLTDDRFSHRSWHRKLLKNVLSVSVQKNLVLSTRIFCTAPKSVRGRLLTYLSAQSRKAGSTAFEIPFSRQQMADYLNLDRSALSKELGRMREDGILEFQKNRFILKQRDKAPD